EDLRVAPLLGLDTAPSPSRTRVGRSCLARVTTRQQAPGSRWWWWWLRPLPCRNALAGCGERVRKSRSVGTPVVPAAGAAPPELTMRRCTVCGLGGPHARRWANLPWCSEHPWGFRPSGVSRQLTRRDLLSAVTVRRAGNQPLNPGFRAH